MRQRRENIRSDKMGLPPVVSPLCTKRAFQSKRRAKLAIRRMQALPLSTNQRGKWKAYRCRLCRNWHLTSGPKP